jgi:hypothetical protein
MGQYSCTPSCSPIIVTNAPKLPSDSPDAESGRNSNINQEYSLSKAPFGEFHKFDQSTVYNRQCESKRDKEREERRNKAKRSTR